MAADGRIHGPITLSRAGLGIQQQVSCILETAWEAEGLERMTKRRQGENKTYKLLWIRNAKSGKYRKGAGLGPPRIIHHTLIWIPW